MKAAQYAERVACRKTCEVCSPDLENPSRVAGGTLDSDQIGPYSQWQGSLGASLIVVAQDFADRDAFVRYHGWPGSNVPTNVALVDLLGQAGLAIHVPNRGQPDERAFFTNAVLCLKQGGMQASVPKRCFDSCGRRFLRPLIDMIAPAVVATLGLGALNAVLRAYGQPRAAKLGPLVSRNARFQLSEATTLIPVVHPGSRGRQFRSLELQRQDWNRLGRLL